MGNGEKTAQENRLQLAPRNGHNVPPYRQWLKDNWEAARARNTSLRMERRKPESSRRSVKKISRNTQGRGG